MSARAPAYDPESINALARVLAEAALNELMNEMTNAAAPGQVRRGVQKDLDGADDTRPVSR